MEKEQTMNWKKLLRTVLIVLACAAAVALLVVLFLHYDLWGLMQDETRMRALVEQAGPWAPLVFMALQFLQVLCSPIPGNVTTLVGGMVFGFAKTLIFSVIAVTLGGLAAFGLSRKFGLKLANRWMGEEKVRHYQQVVEGRQTSALFIMFLMPFFPDDLLCFVAGLTDISWKRFTVLSLTTRPWGLIASALLGSQAMDMSVPMLVVCGVAMVAFAVAGLIYGPRIEARVTQWIRERKTK